MQSLSSHNSISDRTVQIKNQTREKSSDALKINNHNKITPTNAAQRAPTLANIDGI